MTKATIFYILSLILSVAILWGIFKVGRTLQAPRDISGTWQNPDVENTSQDSLHLSQSGRYLVVHRQGQPPLSLILTTSNNNADGRWEMIFASGPQQLTIQGEPESTAEKSQAAQFKFSGPTTETWHGIRWTVPTGPSPGKH